MFGKKPAPTRSNGPQPSVVPRPERAPIPRKLRFEVFRRDDFTCRYCGGKSPERGGTKVLEVDHVSPVAQGGNNELRNLVTACADCNRGKGATVLSPTLSPTLSNGGTKQAPDRWERCSIVANVSHGWLGQKIVVVVIGEAGQILQKGGSVDLGTPLSRPVEGLVPFRQLWDDLSREEAQAILREIGLIRRDLLTRQWEEITDLDLRRVRRR